MTLAEYLIHEYKQGKIDHSLRCHIDDRGQVEIYIHPLNASGLTTPTLIVHGNTVIEKQYKGLKPKQVGAPLPVAEPE